MRKNPIIYILILSLCLFALFLPACGDGEANVLAVTLRGETLTWDAVSGADHYEVHCTLTDGSSYTIKVRDLSYTPPYKKEGDYLYTVKAVNGKGRTLALSEKVAYHLGKGSPSDPISIATAEELLAIKGSATLTFGETKVSAPLYYRMTADVDLTGREFTPIGDSANPFKGVFDGNGHTIKGLAYTKCNTDGAMGLFGVIDHAVVKNLTLTDASILFDKDSGVKKGALRFGLLVGYAIASDVDNCHVKGDVDILAKVITVDDQILSVGGVIGLVNSGRVSGCSFRGNVKAQYGIAYAGGLVGEAKGSSPDFQLVNSMAVANVSAVGTAYNITTGVSYAYARAGVLVGSITHTERLASLLAVGSATASTTKDGTAKSSLTAGVFGKTNSNSGGVNSAPMYNIFYSDTIEKVSGTATSLGTYANNVYPLTETQMKERGTYLAGNDYALDFDLYWSLPEGEIPTLKGASSLANAPDLTLAVRAENDLSYDVVLNESFLPEYFTLSLLNGSERDFGYSLATLLDKMGITLDANQRVKVSAEGMDDLILPVGTGGVKCYFVYATYPAYEKAPAVFGGYKVVDANSLKTYDFTNAKVITITVLSAESAN